jgi:hypothetical protein
MAREGTDATLLNNQLLRQPYNANAERARRAALNTLMTRTSEAEASENEVSTLYYCTLLNPAAVLVMSQWCCLAQLQTGAVNQQS